MINYLLEILKKLYLYFIKEYILLISQFGLIILHLLSFEYTNFAKDSSPEKTLALALIICGSIIIITAIIKLGRNISPLPRPRKDSDLKTTGIYAYARHPIYFGLILISIANPIFNYSIYKIILTILLMINLTLKIKLEEKYLLEKFPYYSNYKKKVKL